MPLSKPAAFVRVVSNKFKASTALHAAPNSSVLLSAKGAVFKIPRQNTLSFPALSPMYSFGSKKNTFTGTKAVRNIPFGVVKKIVK